MKIEITGAVSDADALIFEQGQKQSWFADHQFTGKKQVVISDTAYIGGDPIAGISPERSLVEIYRGPCSFRHPTAKEIELGIMSLQDIRCVTYLDDSGVPVKESSHISIEDVGYSIKQLKHFSHSNRIEFILNPLTQQESEEMQSGI